MPKKAWYKNKAYLLALLGAVIFLASNWFPVDNVASYHRPISKQAATTLATSWVENIRGEKVQSHLTMFDTDSELSAALQHKNQLNKYNKTFSDVHPIDYYVVELKTDKNTYRVHVHYLKKKIVGWKTLIVTDSPSDKTIARSFLNQRGFTDVEATNTLDNKYLNYDLKKSFMGMKLKAKISTDATGVTSFTTYFQLSSSALAWQDAQALTRAGLEIASMATSILLFIIAVILVFIFGKRLYFSRGWLLASVFFILQGLTLWNMYPVIRLMVEDVNSIGMTINGLVNQTLFYLGYAGFVYLCFIVGDQLWRSYKKTDETYHLTLSPGLLYVLALGVLGLQSLIYLYGDYLFNVWSTNEPWMAMDNIAFPLLFPLTAWTAAISEEVVYRLFALMVFYKLFHRFLPRKPAMVIAALLSSAMWAVGHASYPVFPAISRFVEVTALGLVFSAIFLRYGLIAAIMVHAIIDSILMSFAIQILPDSDPTLYAFVALNYILLPLFISVIIRNRTRTSSQVPEDLSR